MSGSDSDGKLRSGTSEDSDSGEDADMCILCDQKFGDDDEDAPLGYTVKVCPVKKGRAVCKECHYVHRGSFTGKSNEETSKVDAMADKCKAVPELKSKFRILRKAKVVQRCRFPGRRPRHTKVDVPDLLRRAEENYVDITSVPCRV